ncbi:LETM1-like protein [Hyunsoonleella jejuensis]|uniref:LETM1-like protein n=1 Tax=Hyunsoonleella jejuensis TaxID=419940 RepID=A0A1H9J1J9_9FLAO|nr:LETM1-related biofilm-associated protein [Hyunsoonleella jejuensis]SEQ80658.1 LETM1-like protein [Hyunsoonleella jejuensis]
MNPSSSGWIKKLESEVVINNRFLSYNMETFYDALRSCGFVYGSNRDVAAQVILQNDIKLTEDEICKINLYLALFYTHKNSKVDNDFVKSVIEFYSEINANNTSFLSSFLGGNEPREQLEGIIHKRIQIDDNVFTKNFNYFLVNALLYLDVLGYQKFLEQKELSASYMKNLEAAIVTISLDVLNSKETKNDYDESLMELFESSLRYHNTKSLDYKKAIELIVAENEKFYMLDLACMATWSDQTIDVGEHAFLEKLGKDLNLNLSRIHQSIKSINNFYSKHKDSIALFNSKNAVKNFYNNSTSMVNKLITRNRKRLYKELVDSKDLMVLLTQSTVRELNKEEQHKVQEQLLDIFKSIPSLAIFMLPGGALLLPLVVKFIPKLLPSAFDENRIEK